MADSIKPTQPIMPSMPLKHELEDKQQEKPSDSDEHKEQKNDNDKPPPHKGLLDEYV